jgi:hypothetical protein
MTLSPFDHIKEIYTKQRMDYFDTLSDDDKKTFQPYMINRIISMNPDFIEIANEAQKYYGTFGPRELYLFYSQIIPKGNYYNKYIKAIKEIEYEFWLVLRLADHFQISRAEAIDYLRLYYASDAGKDTLRQICEIYATDPKLIKKAKL